MKNRRYIGTIIAWFAAVLLTGCNKNISNTPNTPNTNSEAYAYYEQGKELWEKGEVVEAMQAFICAERASREGTDLRGRIYSNMATMCRQAERHEQAYSFYRLSSRQFAAAEQSQALAYAYNNMAWAQAVMGNKSKAVVLADSAVAICPDDAVRSKVNESYAAACLYAEEYDSVLYYARGIADTVYRDMLSAQAFCLLQVHDSALCYAERVVAKTRNPRYLDDAYYVLAHSDSGAEREDMLLWSEQRTDAQREIETYKSEMAQAVLLLQDRSLLDSTWSLADNTWASLVVGLCLSGAIFWFLFRTNKHRQIERISLQLHQSADPKNNIPWEQFNLPDKLKERGLSEREIRIATLVMYGFSYAQIADILHRAENGIGKDKYLIAKKLGVTVKELQNKIKEIACKL